MSGEFEAWLSGRLSEFNADGEVFSSYILGILNDNDSDSDKEKEDNLADLLEGLGLDDGSPDPCQRIQSEIWTKWSKLSAAAQSHSQRPENCESKGKALGAAVVAHAESQTKAYVASRGASSSTKDDNDRKAVKAAVLAQYNNAVEDSDDGDEVSEDGDDNDEFKNSNAEAVAKAQAEQREKSKAAALAKKEKDKEDREKQKKDQEDRKKKAQDKAQKGERRR